MAHPVSRWNYFIYSLNKSHKFIYQFVFIGLFSSYCAICVIPSQPLGILHLFLISGPGIQSTQAGHSDGEYVLKYFLQIKYPIPNIIIPIIVTKVNCPAAETAGR